MLRIPYALLILTISASAYANERSFDCLRPTKMSGSEYAKLVQKRYSELSSFKASFEQSSSLAALETEEQSSGDVFFSKPGKMRWNYAKPEEQVFVLNDQTLWLYQKESNQVMIDNLSHVLISDLPVAFLLGIGDLTRDFSVEKSCESPSGVVLELNQKRANKDGDNEEKLKGFKLLIEPRTFEPKGAYVEDVGGNVTAIVFNDLKLGAKIDSATFNPNFPKGVDVQDRRLQNGEVG